MSVPLPKIDAFPELPHLQRHIAILMIEDMPPRAIARRLGVTVGTVSTAKWRLLSKLDLNGAAGLTRLAIRRGYLAP